MEEVIESDAVLQIVVGIAELLIFPSTLLPEQYHGKCPIGDFFLISACTIQDMTFHLVLHGYYQSS